MDNKQLEEKKIFCSKLCKHFNIVKNGTHKPNHYECIINKKEFALKLKLQTISIIIKKTKSGIVKQYELAYCHSFCSSNFKKSIDDVLLEAKGDGWRWI